MVQLSHLYMTTAKTMALTIHPLTWGHGSRHSAAILSSLLGKSRFLGRQGWERKNAE